MHGGLRGEVALSIEVLVSRVALIALRGHHGDGDSKSHSGGRCSGREPISTSGHHERGARTRHVTVRPCLRHLRHAARHHHRVRLLRIPRHVGRMWERRRCHRVRHSRGWLMLGHACGDRRKVAYRLEVRIHRNLSLRHGGGRRCGRSSDGRRWLPLGGVGFNSPLAFSASRKWTLAVPIVRP